MISRINLFLIAAFLGIAVAGCKKQQAIVLPPPNVEVATVVEQDVPIFREWIGTLDGYVNAQIRAQVSGYLLSQNYKEGALVKKGDLLFQIDPRIIQATLDQAKGQLAQAQAQQGRTQIDVNRYTPLAKEGAISQQELDNAVQSNYAAEADVQAAQASVEKAAVDLEFTKIISPVDGIAGLANAQVGDLVSPSSEPLTTISTVNPMKVIFTISEQEYIDMVTALPDAQARAEFRDQLNMELIFPNEQVYDQKGKFFALQRQVDQKTGTLQVAGVFPNPDNVLRPGQFVRVRVHTSTRKNAMLVPQRAVTQLQSLFQVAVINSEDKAEIRTVEVGERVGVNWIVTGGLKPGDRVVAEGVQKVTQGLHVNVSPYIAPSTQPATKPAGG